jgi:hypothetical protein
VRDARLKAVRIGKQYRIAREDLEAFTGRPVAAPEVVRRERHTEVSSVVQIDAVSPELASRVSNTLMATANSRDDADQPLRVDTIYDEERGRLKVIITGSIATTVAMLRFVVVLTETGT